MTVEFAEVEPPQAEIYEFRASDPLGALEPLISLIEACRPSDPLIARPRLVVFAGDHGIAQLGVSAFPQLDTRRRIIDLAKGVGRRAAIAAGAGVGIRAVDIAVDDELDGTGVDTSVKVRRSSGRIDIEDALSADELDAALEAGRTIADVEIDEGADLLVGAVCGVAVTTPTAVLVAGFLGIEPVDATSRGSGIGDSAWIRKVAIVRDALYRTRLIGTDADTLLRCAGGADLAALTGFIAQAAARRTVVLVDDVPSTVAALLANRFAPGSSAFVVCTSLAPERTHHRLLEVLGKTPLTSWSVRAGGGTAATLLVPTIAALVRKAEDMKGEAGVDRTVDAIDEWDTELL